MDVLAAAPLANSAGDFLAKGFGIIFAVCLVLIHMSAPYYQGIVERHERQLSSLGRGLAVTYVFLQLFDEIAAGKAVIGSRIHALLLLGFLLYYGVEHTIESRITRESADPKHPLVRLQFGILLFFKWVYSWLLIYAIPPTIREDGLYLVPGLVAVCLHTLHDDAELVSRFKRHYQHEGRYLLATAPVVGWWSHRVLHAQYVPVTYVLTALLAGSVLYTTFSGELQQHRKSLFRWFVIGVLLYVGLHAFSGE